MTGPEGERPPGWWRIDAVDPPSSLEFTGGFTDEQGAPAAELPTTSSRVRIFRPGGWHADGVALDLRI